MYSDGGLGHHSEVPSHISTGSHAASGGSQIPQLVKASGSVSSSARGNANVQQAAGAHAVKPNASSAAAGTIKSPTSKAVPHADLGSINGASQRRPSGDKGEFRYIAYV